MATVTVCCEVQSLEADFHQSNEMPGRHGKRTSRTTCSTDDELNHESLKLSNWRRQNARHAKPNPEGSPQGCAECILARVLVGTSLCSDHGTIPCQCPHKQFQSTKNSKRNLHLYTFWMFHLGPDFPVTDAMLVNVKPLLKSTCDKGIK